MRSLALALFAWTALGAAAASGAPTLPLSHSGRWLIDARGRVVVVHGINMVYKRPPYYPAAVGFGDDDARFLAAQGFNVVRVGVIWKALEPQPGVYDEAYVNHIVDTVRTLARHGILSLLDFHQDLYNERFQGEGAPDWAVQDGALPNPTLGFPGNYVGNLALEHALDAFWNNSPGPGGVGLADRFAGAWADIAARARTLSSVLGYEEFNEPFPGTAWEPCVAPTGCAGFDALLTSFARRVDAGIRKQDRRTLVFEEPTSLFNFGAATQIGSLGDARGGFAFHDYCATEGETGAGPCVTPDDLVFANALSHVGATHEALLMTEFGATDDAPYLQDMVARSDRLMVPWIEWHYCGCDDPTTSGPGNKQAIVKDPAKPPTGSNLVIGTLGALVEPYPQVIAGTPVSWSFDPATRAFALTYSTARAGGGRRFAAGTLTEVATPPRVYGGRYSVSASGGAIVSRRGAGLLRVASCPAVKTITIRVTPGRRLRSSCPRPRRRRRR